MSSRAFGRIHKGFTLAVAVVVVAVALLWWAWARENAAPKELLLADGTQLILLNGTRAFPPQGFPKNRQIQLQGNGDVLIKVPAETNPLIVHTGLLILTVEGRSALRVLVSSDQIGEQVEVLYGHVRAAKAYSSQFSEPDDLAGGEMSMVNKSIDLMEKEKFDSTQLEQWSKDVIAAAERYTVQRQ